MWMSWVNWRMISSPNSRALASAFGESSPARRLGRPSDPLACQEGARTQPPQDLSADKRGSEGGGEEQEEIAVLEEQSSTDDRRVGQAAPGKREAEDGADHRSGGPHPHLRWPP